MLECQCVNGNGEKWKSGKSFRASAILHAEAEYRLILIKHYFKEVLHHAIDDVHIRSRVPRSTRMDPECTRRGASQGWMISTD